MVQRVCLRRRNPYNTRSNQRRQIIRTPGAKLIYHHLKKVGTVPKCGDCGDSIQGVPILRPKGYMQVSRNKKSVSRAYGGSRCGTCVRQRIMRAFLIEEAKVVKKVIKSQTPKAARGE